MCECLWMEMDKGRRNREWFGENVCNPWITQNKNNEKKKIHQNDCRKANPLQTNEQMKSERSENPSKRKEIREMKKEEDEEVEIKNLFEWTKREEKWKPFLAGVSRIRWNNAERQGKI